MNAINTPRFANLSRLSNRALKLSVASCALLLTACNVSEGPIDAVGQVAQALITPEAMVVANIDEGDWSSAMGKSKYNSAMAALSNDRGFSVYVSEDDDRVRGLVHDDFGAVLSGPIELDTVTSWGDHQEPAVATQGNRVAVVWQGRFGNDDKQIVTSYFQVDNNGSFTPAGHVRVNDANVAGSNDTPDVTFLPNGRYVVSWTHHAGSSADVITKYKMALCDHKGCGSEIELQGSTNDGGLGMSRVAVTKNKQGQNVVGIVYEQKLDGGNWDIVFESRTQIRGGWKASALSVVADEDINVRWPDITASARGFVVSAQRGGYFGEPDASILLQTVAINGTLVGTGHEIVSQCSDDSNAGAAGVMFPRLTRYDSAASSPQKIAVAFNSSDCDEDWTITVADFDLETGNFTETNREDTDDVFTTATHNIAVEAWGNSRAVSYSRPNGWTGTENIESALMFVY